jgi:hypothetical protein
VMVLDTKAAKSLWMIRFDAVVSTGLLLQDTVRLAELCWIWTGLQRQHSAVHWQNVGRDGGASIFCFNGTLSGSFSSHAILSLPCYLASALRQRRRSGRVAVPPQHHELQVLPPPCGSAATACRRSCRRRRR